jgi:hypothetical protein
VEDARLVTAKVERKMLRMTGDGLIRACDLDILVACEEALLEVETPLPSDTSWRMAKHAASLIPDGATIQFGMYRVLLALLGVLKDKHNRGIRAETVTDGIIEVLQAGAATGPASRTVGVGSSVVWR